MEYEIVYSTNRFVVIFEITTWGVVATIYNKDVPFDEEWITVATDSMQADNVSTDFQLCRDLFKRIRKDHNI